MKADKQEVAEVLLRLFVEGLTGKDAGQLPKNLVTNGEFRFSVKGQSFNVVVTEVEEKETDHKV